MNMIQLKIPQNNDILAHTVRYEAYEGHQRAQYIASKVDEDR